MSDQQQDQVFKALADPHRRRILSALCAEPRVAGELGRLVSLAPNAVSFHLRLLQEAGLVSVRRQGRFLWYQVEKQPLEEWKSYAQHLFGDLAGARTFDAYLSEPPEYKPVGRHPGAKPVLPLSAEPEARVDQPPETPADPADHPEEKLPTELL